MMNNIKLGVTLSDIKVAEGGCVVAGKAELSGIDVAILNEKQRQNLAMAYEIYKKTLDIAEELAPEIAKGINSVKDYFESIKAKKEATRKLLAQSNIEDLSEVLNNCGEIVSQSRVAQDSLEKTICLIKKGKAKGNIAKLEKASKANIDFINKLGPTLAQCQNTTFTPWSEQPCKGPCAFEFESYVVDEECMKKIQAVFGVIINEEGMFESFEIIEGQTVFKCCPNPFLIWTPTDFHLKEIGDEIKVLKILHKDWSDSRLYLTASWNVYKGIIHTSLDIIGLVPLVGELADGTNAVFYLAEGDKVNASLSAISIIPVVGDAAGKGSKVTRKVLTWFKVGNRYFSSPARKVAYEVLYNKYGGAKVADAIWDAANSKLIRKAIDDAGKGLSNAWEAHHMIPKELIEEYVVIQNAIKQGFDFNKIDNLIPLEKATRHRGSHPLFTNRVRIKLNKLMGDNPNKQAKEIVEMAVNDIKKAINTQNTKHIEQVVF
ncbi:MAG: AHH domain-containing protein [Spirosomataceae bacterium]